MSTPSSPHPQNEDNLECASAAYQPIIPAPAERRLKIALQSPYSVHFKERFWPVRTHRNVLRVQSSLSPVMVAHNTDSLHRGPPAPFLDMNLSLSGGLLLRLRRARFRLIMPSRGTLLAVTGTHTFQLTHSVSSEQDIGGHTTIDFSPHYHPCAFYSHTGIGTSRAGSAFPSLD